MRGKLTTWDSAVALDVGDANETHDWRTFADFAQHLIGIARPRLPRIRWAWAVKTPNLDRRLGLRWWPPSASVWNWMRVSTRFYRFSVSRFLKKSILQARPGLVTPSANAEFFHVRRVRPWIGVLA
jgi:hypothetical protein